MSESSKPTLADLVLGRFTSFDPYPRDVVEDAMSEVRHVSTNLNDEHSIAFGRPVLLVRGRGTFSETEDPIAAIDWFMSQVDPVLSETKDVEVCFWLPAGTDPAGHQAPHQMRHFDPVRVGGAVATIAQKYPEVSVSMLAGFWLDEDPSTLIHDFAADLYSDYAYRRSVMEQYLGVDLLFSKLYLDAFGWAPEEDREPWRLYLEQYLHVKVVGEAASFASHRSAPPLTRYRKMKWSTVDTDRDGVRDDMRGTYLMSASFKDQLAVTRCILSHGATPMISHGPDSSIAVAEASLAKRACTDPNVTLCVLADRWRSRGG